MTAILIDSLYSLYRHFLTPAQFRARYEPSRAQAQKVERILRSLGLKVVSVERDRRWVVARGSAHAADVAFGFGFAADALGMTGDAAGARASRSAKPLPPVDLRTRNKFVDRNRPAVSERCAWRLMRMVAEISGLPELQINASTKASA